MQRLIRVSIAIALAQCFLLAAATAQAAEGVVLIGCDLFSQDGPRVAFVQSHGVARGGNKAKRRLFISGSGFRPTDFEGRPCAEVLSEAADDGLVFQALNVFGEDAELGLWFFQDR